MSIEQSLVCDRCSRIIGAGHTVAEVREENRQNGGSSHFGTDFCPRCAAASGENDERETG